MLGRHQLHHYQEHAAEFAVIAQRCMLWIDLGLGKTAITLTAITELLDALEVRRVLVVAPLRVAKQGWPAEVAQWEHTRHLRVSVCVGSAKDRIAALNRKADVYCINYENLYWLAKVKGIKNHFDMIVLDESRTVSNKTAKCSRAARFLCLNAKRVIELTATPAPNSYMDLFHQVYLVDRGQRFGETLKGFRFRYFDSYLDEEGRIKYKVKSYAKDAIYKALDGVALTLRKEDYLDMPPRTDIEYAVEMTPEQREKYDDFEQQFVLEMCDVQIEAVTSAALLTKLAQLSNGAVYDTERNVHKIHDHKIDALRELVAQAGDEPVLVAYNFISDRERIKAAFPQAVVMGKDPETINRWNRGEIPMLLVHPKRAGHGLNLQHGGSIVIWFSPNWSLELDQQLNARLHRQGQTKPVRVYRIICKGTIDEDILGALRNKDKMQDSLLDAVKLVVNKVKSHTHGQQAA